MICFDSHLHIGEVYYGKRAKSTVKFSAEEALSYFKSEEITHCNVLYTPESIEEMIKLYQISGTTTTVFPFKWVSRFDGREEEKFDPRFDRGIKMHPIRTHDGERKDLNCKEVYDYIETLPEQTPTIIHTQDCRFEKDTSFFTVMKLAQRFPTHKFVIAHAGSAGPASRLPSNRILNERFKDGLNYIGTNIVDSALIFGALQCSYLMSNVYCDLSSLAPNSLKLQILGQNSQFLKKVMIGADKPFFGKIGIREEEKQLKRFLGLSEEEISQLHERALFWLFDKTVGQHDYKDQNYNLAWVNDQVRTEKRWSYQPRNSKKIV